jgi:hypothetical protein
MRKRVLISKTAIKRYLHLRMGMISEWFKCHTPYALKLKFISVDWISNLTL